MSPVGPSRELRIAPIALLLGFTLTVAGTVATVNAYGGRWSDPDAAGIVRTAGPVELIVGLLLTVFGVVAL